MKRLSLGVILVLALVFAASPLLAGMVIEAKNEDGKRFLWACEGGLFRIGTEEAYTIIDTDKQMTYTVIPEKKIYYASSAEENRERMKAMQEQMKKMQQALGAMGKKFGKLFGGDQAPAPEEKPVKHTYKKTGKKARIAGYDAEQVVVYENGRPVSEIWVSPKLAKDLNRSCDLRKLSQMTEASLPEEWKQPEQAVSVMEMKEFQELGYPLKEVSYDGEFRQEVTKVEKKSLPKSFFSVPEGYKQVSYPSPQGGMRPW